MADLNEQRPRVFLSGEPIPPGTLALTVGGWPYDNLASDEPTTCPFPLVELQRPDRAYLESAIRDAQARRGPKRTSANPADLCGPDAEGRYRLRHTESCGCQEVDRG